MSRQPELAEARLGNLEAGASLAAAALAGTALATTSLNGFMPTANFAALAPPVASMTALGAIAAASRADGMVCLVKSDVSGCASLWQFVAASAATDTSQNLVMAPAAGTGAWLRLPGMIALLLPVLYTTADAAVIFTMPTGAKFHPFEAWWDVGTSWTGGSSSAIGVHASPTGWTTKGDILGGAGGDVAATLVSTNTRMTGTIGAKMATRTNGRLVMIAADTLLFDQITSTFTAGAASVRVLGQLIANPGA